MRLMSHSRRYANTVAFLPAAVSRRRFRSYLKLVMLDGFMGFKAREEEGEERSPEIEIEFDSDRDEKNMSDTKLPT